MPAHGAKFDVTTGAVAEATRGSTVEKYAVRVKGDAIEVEVETGWSQITTPPEPKKPIGNNLAFLRFRFYLVLHKSSSNTFLSQK